MSRVGPVALLPCWRDSGPMHMYGALEMRPVAVLGFYEALYSGTKLGFGAIGMHGPQ